MFMLVVISHISTRWTCTPTPQSPATQCSQDYTMALQRSWRWIFQGLREQRSTQPLFIQMDTAVIRVHSSYSMFHCCQIHHFTHHISLNQLLFWFIAVQLNILSNVLYQHAHTNRSTGFHLSISCYSCCVILNNLHLYNSSFLCTCLST